MVIINPDKQLGKIRFYLLWFERYLFSRGEQGETDVLGGRIMFVLKMTDKDLAYKKLPSELIHSSFPFYFQASVRKKKGKGKHFVSCLTCFSPFHSGG